ncbi:hypothetical protein DAI22_08g030000 [Oryza sativa Japonica Group]|jgi:hypothetical protein|nr:hypothetical protein DAI22_08g030000 [Oryza sativa Japonica Group]
MNAVAIIVFAIGEELPSIARCPWGKGRACSSCELRYRGLCLLLPSRELVDLEGEVLGRESWIWKAGERKRKEMVGR